MLKHTSTRINLRPDRDKSPSALVPALPPQALTLPPGWRPIGSISDRLIVSKGAAISVAGSDMAPVQLDGEPLFMLRIDDSSFLVTTAFSTSTVDIDLSSERLSVRPSFDEMLPSLRAVEAGRVTASVDAVEAKIADLQSGILSSTVSRRLVSAAVSAYEGLSAAATAEGVCIHPILARVRAVDSAGRQLFITEPVVLSHPSADEFDGRIEFGVSSASVGYVEAGDISSSAWLPELIMPEKLRAALPAGSVVEVLASQPLAAYDASRSPRVAVRRRSDEALATVSLIPAWRRVADVAISAESEFYRVWATRTPLGAETFTPLWRSKTVATAPVINVSSAVDAAIASDVVVWAAPSSVRQSPPAPDSYAVGTVDQPWSGYTAVDFADGTRCVTVASGSAAAPVSFSPLFSYADADAVAIEIAVSTGGEVRRGRYALVASGSSRRAVCVDMSLRPRTLPDVITSFVPPVASTRRKRYASSVAVASAAAPQQAFSLVGPGCSSVTAVIDAVIGQSAWDYGRSRFYVFTSDGIHLLSADPVARSASMALIDSRVVGARQAVCRVDGAVAVIASGDILLLCGRRLTKIARIPSATALAYNHDSHELWCITPEGAEVICLDCKNLRYTMSGQYDSTSVVATASMSYVSSVAGSTYVVGHGRHTPVEIAFERTITAGKPAAFERPARLVLDIPGTYERLEITATRTDTVASAPGAEMRLVVAGRISAPLRIPLHLPPTARNVAVRIAGIASPSTRLISASLI